MSPPHAGALPDITADFFSADGIAAGSDIAYVSWAMKAMKAAKKAAAPAPAKKAMKANECNSSCHCMQPHHEAELRGHGQWRPGEGDPSLWRLQTPVQKEVH